MTTEIIELNRRNKSVTWGFSIQGGKEFGCPLSILRVSKDSIADRFGIAVQDMIVKINEQPSANMTHQQAILLIQNLDVKLEMRKAGSDTFSVTKKLPDQEFPPPPIEDLAISNNRMSVNVELPPPPPDVEPIGMNNSCAVPPPPPPPPAASTPCIKAPVKMTSHSKIVSAPLPYQPSEPRPSLATIAPTFGAPAGQDTIDAFQRKYSAGNIGLQTNRNTPNVALDPKNVDKFQRKYSEVNPKMSSSSLALGQFLQTNTKPAPVVVFNEQQKQDFQKPPQQQQHSGTKRDHPQQVQQIPQQQKQPSGVGPATKDSSGLNVLATNARLDAAICFVCKDHIKGPYIEANNKIYCTEHFCCSYCHKSIKGSQFIETKEGTLYCLDDFTTHVAPSCGLCGQAIIEQQVMALGRAWHPACFQCHHCKQPIPQGNFHVRDDDGEQRVYCERDYKTYFEIKCFACKFSIDGDDKYVRVGGNNYHVDCYKR